MGVIVYKGKYWWESVSESSVVLIYGRKGFSPWTLNLELQSNGSLDFCELLTFKGLRKIRIF